MKVGYGERNYTDPFGVAPGRKDGTLRGRKRPNGEVG